MNIQNDILCPECGKDFGTLPRFHKHFRQYHKKNESKCTSCEKTFNTAYILRQHVTKVHETKKCDICDLDFAKGALARHKEFTFKSSLSVNSVAMFSLGKIIFKHTSGFVEQTL